jgi:transcriptional regulator GlxA family with amidase domain
MKEAILSNTPDTKKDWVSRVLEIIEQNLSNPNLDVAMLARELAVSDRQLFRFLKKYTGFSPNQLMHETRLCMAYHLLASNPAIPIAQVSLQVGFDNSGYFSVVFKKRFGINPSELRDFEET